MRAVRVLWPHKTAAHLSDEAEISERWAKELLALRANLSGEQLDNLLHCDKGLAILEAIMGDAEYVWWRDFKRKTRRENLRRQIADLQKLKDEIDED